MQLLQCFQLHQWAAKCNDSPVDPSLTETSVCESIQHRQSLSGCRSSHLMFIFQSPLWPPEVKILQKIRNRQPVKGCMWEIWWHLVAGKKIAKTVFLSFYSILLFVMFFTLIHCNVQFIELHQWCFPLSIYHRHLSQTLISLWTERPVAGQEMNRRWLVWVKLVKPRG